MACTDPCDCPVNKLDAVLPPTVNDDGCNTSGNGVFCPNSIWRDTNLDEWWINVDATCEASDWQKVMGKQELTHFSVVISSLIKKQIIPTSVSTLLEAGNVTSLPLATDNWDGGTYELTVGTSGIYLVQADFVAENVTKATATPENGRLCNMSLYVNGTFRGNPASASAIFIRDGESITLQGTGALQIPLNAGDILTMRIFHTFGNDITLDDVSGNYIRNSWKVSRLTEYTPV